MDIMMDVHQEILAIYIIFISALIKVAGNMVPGRITHFYPIPIIMIFRLLEM